MNDLIAVEKIAQWQKPTTLPLDSFLGKRSGHHHRRSVSSHVR